MSTKAKLRAADQGSPARTATEVTPSDVTVFDPLPNAFFIGTGGHVTITTVDGDVVEFKNCADGFILPVAAVYVMAATTAQDIVALYF